MNKTIINSRNELLKLIPINSVIAELGVFVGDFSKIIIETCQPKELHLIDIWDGKMCSADKDGNGMIYIDDMYQVYLDLQKQFKNQPNVKLHRSKSVDALSSFPDKYFDFIYIDALHSYDGVYSDLIVSYKKSKRFIGGHDYCMAFSEVMRGVDDFCKNHKLEIKYLTVDGCPSFLIDLNSAT